MSVCLCNLSADAVLELAAQGKLSLEPASPDPTSFTTDVELARKALGELAEELPRPIELLTGSLDARRRKRGLAAHVWRGPLPEVGFLALGGGAYVTSPEFTLLQQASQLHQASLCQMLGRYLGTWSPAKGHQSGQVERAPLTTFDSLRAFAREMSSARGMHSLRFAMAYTCDGAASAPETSLQLVLCLPPELHGFGLEQPIMNYEVDLSPEARQLYPRDSIRIDLCWRDAMFGLEYQGDEHGMQLGEDYARCFAAREESYELWYLAKEQLESAVQMGHIARKVARRIGSSANEDRWPTEDELQDLLDVLAGRKHLGPESYEVLRSVRRREGRR